MEKTIEMLKELFQGAKCGINAFFFCPYCLGGEIVNNNDKFKDIIDYEVDAEDHSLFLIKEDKSCRPFESSCLRHKGMEVEADYEALTLHILFECESCKTEVRLPIFINW